MTVRTGVALLATSLFFISYPLGAQTDGPERSTRPDASSVARCHPTPGTDDVLDCYPTPMDYETGSVTSLVRTQFSLVHASGEGLDVDRGYMVFNTTAIPDGATINSVRLNAYVYENNNPWWYITRLSGDPRTGAPGTVFDDIAFTDTDGYYLYRQDPTLAPGWYYYDLPAQAASDLQARLTDDWFAVGFHEEDAGVLFYIHFHGWFEANIPYITVDFTPPVAADEPVLAIADWIDPEPADAWVGTGTTDVEVLWSKPAGLTIDSVVFWHSPDSLSWAHFWTDLDGGEDWMSTHWVSPESGDGWTGYFDSDELSPPPIQTTPLFIRADIHTDGGVYQAVESRTYDPTPPLFTLDIEDDQVFVSGTLNFTAVEEYAGDADHFDCSDASDYGINDKKMPKFCQYNPNYPNGGSTYCAPTAAAACLKWFSTVGGNSGLVPPTISNESLVQDLGDRCDTDDENSGTSHSNMKNGLRGYIKDHGGGYNVRGKGNTTGNSARYWKKMAAAVNACYDVLPTITWPNGKKHKVTMTGVRKCGGKT